MIPRPFGFWTNVGHPPLPQLTPSWPSPGWAISLPAIPPLLLAGLGAPWPVPCPPPPQPDPNPPGQSSTPQPRTPMEPPAKPHTEPRSLVRGVESPRGPARKHRKPPATILACGCSRSRVSKPPSPNPNPRPDGWV